MIYNAQWERYIELNLMPGRVDRFDYKSHIPAFSECATGDVNVLTGNSRPFRFNTLDTDIPPLTIAGGLVE